MLSKNKKFNVKDLILAKGDLERAAKAIEQLKSLPNCYSCSGRSSSPQCIYCLVDDSAPSRYNCPLYERDPALDIVENC